MSIIRVQKRTNPYVQIDKRCLENESLSWKAKGLLAYLLSRTDNWTVNVQHLATVSKDSVGAVRTALKELRENGYATLEIVRDEETGMLNGKTWVIYEVPTIDRHTENPDVGKNRRSENPKYGKSHTNNNDINNNKENNKKAVDKCFKIGMADVTETIYQFVEQLKKDEWALSILAKNNQLTLQGVKGLIDGFVEAKALADDLNHKKYSDFKTHFGYWIPKRPRHLQKAELTLELADCELTEEEMSKYVHFLNYINRKYPKALNGVRYFTHSEFRRYLARDFYPTWRYQFTKREVTARTPQLYEKMNSEPWYRQQHANLFEHIKNFFLEIHKMEAA